MSSPDAPKPGQTPDGAENFSIPSRVSPVSRILSDLTTDAVVLRDTEITDSQAEDFVEGFISLMARSFYSRAEEIRRLAGFSDSGAPDALRTAAALEAASDALEKLLPPEKREDRRREF